MTFLRGLAPASALAVGCIACLCVPLAFNGNFYFNDDFQLYFAPMFVEISRLISSGIFPLSTDNSWFGGAIAGEYQYGIFNPVSLLLMLAFGHISDVARAAAFFAIAHYTILCVGAYVLAMSLGYRVQASVTTAMLAVSSGWLLYFGATSWIPAVTSLAWVPWCLAALMLVYRDPRFLPVGSLATAMPLLCGWPFTTIGLALLIGVGLAAGLMSRQPPTRLCVVALAALLGAGLSLPAIAPVIDYLHESTRNLATGNVWSADLPGMLSFGFPSFAERWPGFWPDQAVLAPVYYVAWFLPVVLANSWRRILGHPFPASMLLAALALATMSQLPHLWQFRWAMRFLPLLHVVLAFLAGWAVSRTPLERWRLRPTALALLVPFVFASMAMPERIGLHLATLAVLAGLCGLVMALQARSRGVMPVLVASHLAIYFLIVGVHPFNDALPQWSPPTRHEVATGDRPLTLGLYRPFAAYGPRPDGFWAELPVGNSGLFRGERTINGYSPVLPAGLRTGLCFNHISGACAEAPERLFERDAMTGLMLVDLLRIQAIVAEKGEMAESFRRASAGLWASTGSGQASERFSRVSPLRDFPGRIGWMSGPLDLRLAAASERGDSFEIRAPSDRDVEIVFARPFYPGYAATLNGTPLGVKAYRGFLPLVSVPAGSAGRLVVDYWPAGLSLGLRAAGLIGVFLLAWTMLALRRRRSGLDAPIRRAA